MDLETMLGSMEYRFYPKTHSAWQWKTTLREACRELQITGERPLLTQVIGYLESVIQKRKDVHHSPHAAQGIAELYWFHQIRQQLESTDSAFTVANAPLYTQALSGVITLLAEANADHTTHGNRAVKFLDAWLIQLEAATAPTLLRP